MRTSERSESRDYDGGKKIIGRKRNIIVDTLGLLMAVGVCSASVDDAVAARAILEGLPTEPQTRLEVIWADCKYHNHPLNEWIANKDDIVWQLEIVRRPLDARRFALLPRRWVVERTFSWLGRWRRLSRDYEHLSTFSEAMVKGASIGRMLRRLEAV